MCCPDTDLLIQPYLKVYAHTIKHSLFDKKRYLLSMINKQNLLVSKKISEAGQRTRMLDQNFQNILIPFCTDIILAPRFFTSHLQLFIFSEVSSIPKENFTFFVVSDLVCLRWIAMLCYIDNTTTKISERNEQ